MQLSTALLALGLVDKVGEQEAVKTDYSWNGTRAVLREEKVGVLAWHIPSWSISSHLSVLSFLLKHVWHVQRGQVPKAAILSLFFCLPTVYYRYEGTRKVHLEF